MQQTLLVITNTADEAADYLCQRLSQHNLAFFRFNTDSLPKSLVVSFDYGRPSLLFAGGVLIPADISHIWYRRPDKLKIPVQPAEDPFEQVHIEHEWREAIEGILAHVPIERWMNHPTRNALASHKIEQLSRATSFGFSIPSSLVTQDLHRLRLFWKETDGQMIVKPLASGYIERSHEEEDTAIFTSAVSLQDITDAVDLERCPTLFQKRINKILDVRVTVIDQDVTAVGLKLNDEQQIDIRRNDMADVCYEPCPVPSDIQQRILGLVHSYGLRFAALDFALDIHGKWIFFEINPNGQWAWLDIVGASDLASVFIRSFTHEHRPFS